MIVLYPTGQFISFITTRIIINSLLFLQNQYYLFVMATQVQQFYNFTYPLGEGMSDDGSTEGEDEGMGCYGKQRCYDREYVIRESRLLSQNNNKVKSSLCKNFTQTGACKYGDKCQFAHGTHQLRCNAQLNISYKTRYCNSFLNKKCCVYGFRCNFIHKSNLEVDEQEKWRMIYRNHRETIKQCKGELKGSRLMTVLGYDESG